RIELETEIAKEEAALEAEKLVFVEKEKALQQMQHAFNEMLDDVRRKENEKNLATQKLQHLRERKQSLDDFIQKSAAQVKGLEESITFSDAQIADELGKVAQLEELLKGKKDLVEQKRSVFDEHRSGIDNVRK